jgi:hypothetical protein
VLPGRHCIGIIYIVRTGYRVVLANTIAQNSRSPAVSYDSVIELGCFLDGST